MHRAAADPDTPVRELDWKWLINMRAPESADCRATQTHYGSQRNVRTGPRGDGSVAAKAGSARSSSGDSHDAASVHHGRKSWRGAVGAAQLVRSRVRSSKSLLYAKSPIRCCGSCSRNWLSRLGLTNVISCGEARATTTANGSPWHQLRPIAHPALKPPVTDWAGWLPVGQRVPQRAGMQHMEDGIEHRTTVLSRTATTVRPAWQRWQQRFEQSPRLVCQFVFRHHSPLVGGRIASANADYEMICTNTPVWGPMNILSLVLMLALVLRS